MKRIERVVELGDAAGADQGRSHPRIPQHPRDRHLGQGLAAGFGEVAESLDAPEVLLGHEVGREGAVLGRARRFGDARQVLVREQALSQG